MVGALLFAVVFIAAPAAAESLHSAPLGTAVSGSFSLAGKIIPLPPGEFKLAASYMLPWAIQPAVSLMSFPGLPLTVNYLVPTAVLINKSSQPTVPLIAPGTNRCGAQLQGCMGTSFRSSRRCS